MTFVDKSFSSAIFFYMKDISTAKFVKISLGNHRTAETDCVMDISRPSILVLGGENTRTETDAYFYARMVAQTLIQNDISSGIDIYSVSYKFRDRDCSIDRNNMFKKHGFKIPPNFDIPNNGLSIQYPNYIKEIYEFAFSPRIKNFESGLKNMMVYTHCHGTYVMNMLEERWHQEMNVFYKAPEIKAAQNQLLVINHAPFAPLGVSKFKNLSFFSATDIQINHYNEFYAYMQQHPKKFQPAFFDINQTNMMVVDQIKHDPVFEHGITGLVQTDLNDKRLTKNGKILFATERNALLMGAKTLLESRAAPSDAELLNNNWIHYKELVSRGSKIYKEFLKKQSTR